MTDNWDREAFETALLADLRANGGVATTGPMAGAPLLVLYTKGARSGEERRAILMHSTDGRDYVIAASAGGSPRNPGWFANIEADTNVRVEAGGRTVAATALIAQEPERTQLWDQHVALLPNFAPYPEQSGRAIPMIRLRPVE